MFLENVFEALTEPGEWYIDRAQGKLYYIPVPGEVRETSVGSLPITTQFIVLEGDAEKQKLVRFLAFRGLGFQNTDWEQSAALVPEHDRHKFKTVPLASDAQAAEGCPGVVHLNGASDISIEDCTVAHAGLYAIAAEPGCRRIRVIGNHLYDLGGGGVKFRGIDATGPRELRSGEHLVSDNHIHHIGEVFRAAIGVIGTHVYHTSIIHNHIHHAHYSGVSVGWVWGYAESVARENHIAYNYIHHIGRGVLSDMGAIYTLGIQPGTRIHHNLIHDVVALHYGGWGIYPDEGSSHMVIEDNIIYDTQEDCLHIHYGRELIVRNNIFVAGASNTSSNVPSSVVRLSRAEGHNSLTLTGNILVTQAGGIHHKVNDDSLCNPTYRSDHNVVFDKTRAEPCGAWRPGVKTEQNDSLARIRQAGLEVSSRVADPMFVPASNHPYGLSPDSPARAMGFRDIDLSRVGPRPAHQRS
jgi:hypothetical protein